MTSLFSAPKAPTIAPAPPTPKEDPAAIAARAEAADRERRKRLAGGRASTILTSPLGDTGTANVSAAQLLGG